MTLDNRAGAAALALRVDDMTCGHCAATIKSAIEKVIPGASVEADPASKRVDVKGAADFATVRAIVAEAGYTATQIK